MGIHLKLFFDYFRDYFRCSYRCGDRMLQYDDNRLMFEHNCRSWSVVSQIRRFYIIQDNFH